MGPRFQKEVMDMKNKIGIRNVPSFKGDAVS
jgi:hypothetical protein